MVSPEGSNFGSEEVKESYKVDTSDPVAQVKDAIRDGVDLQEISSALDRTPLEDDLETEVSYEALKTAIEQNPLDIKQYCLILGFDSLTLRDPEIQEAIGKGVTKWASEASETGAGVTRDEIRDILDLIRDSIEDDDRGEALLQSVKKVIKEVVAPNLIEAGEYTEADFFMTIVDFNDGEMTAVALEVFEGLRVDGLGTALKIAKHYKFKENAEIAGKAQDIYRNDLMHGNYYVDDVNAYREYFGIPKNEDDPEHL